MDASEASGPFGAVNVCDTCEERRSVTRAVFGYCADCRLFLCEDCYHVHCDPPPCRNHRMREGDRVPMVRPPAVDMCKTHPLEKIIYFCKVHRALACLRCAFLQHRMCSPSDVCEVSVLSDDATNKQRYQDLILRIETLTAATAENHETSLKNQLKIDSNKEQTKADIRHFFEAIREHLTSMEKDVNEAVDHICGEYEKRMDKIRQTCDKIKADLKALKALLEANNEPSDKDQLFIAIENATATLLDLEKSLKALVNDNHVKEYRFEPESHLKEVKTFVKKAGELVMIGPDGPTSSQQARDMTKRASSSEQASVTSKRIRLNLEVSTNKPRVKVESRWSMDTVIADTADGINVRRETDKKGCRITGSTMVANDTLLAITDNENNAVKLVDVRRKVLVSHIYLKDWPWDITDVQTDQLAVTLPDAHTIQFCIVNNGNSLGLGQQLRVSGVCRGIAHHENRLFISFDNPKQIQIVNMSGTVLTTISSQTNSRVKFYDPLYVTLIANKSILCVSESSANAVYFFDTDGNLKAEFKDKHKHFKCPYGMSAGEDGTVIVCGGSSNSMYLISSDGGKARVLAGKSLGVQLPDCVTYSSLMSTLYVGQEKSNVLKVFELS